MSQAVGEASEDCVSELFHLMVLMTRLFTRFSALPQFKNAGLGFAEWVALSFLEERDGISNKDLAKRLSVSGQRANQIRGSLEAAKLIAVTQSPEDNRRNVIRLTELGRTKLSAVNSELKPLISAATRNRPRVLASATRSVRMVTKLLHVKEPSTSGVGAASPSAQ